MWNRLRRYASRGWRSQPKFMLGAEENFAPRISAKLTAVNRQCFAILTAVKSAPLRFAPAPRALGCALLFSLGITPVDDRGQERGAGPLTKSRVFHVEICVAHQLLFDDRQETFDREQFR